MSNRAFAERLNKALDDIGAPDRLDERVVVFSKLIKVPRFKAEALLNGTLAVDEALLGVIAEELEVDAAWLMAKHEPDEQ